MHIQQQASAHSLLHPLPSPTPFTHPTLLTPQQIGLELDQLEREMLGAEADADGPSTNLDESGMFNVQVPTPVTSGFTVSATQGQHVYMHPLVLHMHLTQHPPAAVATLLLSFHPRSPLCHCVSTHPLNHLSTQPTSPLRC